VAQLHEFDQVVEPADWRRLRSESSGEHLIFEVVFVQQRDDPRAEVDAAQLALLHLDDIEVALGKQPRDRPLHGWRGHAAALKRAWRQQGSQLRPSLERTQRALVVNGMHGPPELTLVLLPVRFAAASVGQQ